MLPVKLKTFIFMFLSFDFNLAQPTITALYSYVKSTTILLERDDLHSLQRRKRAAVCNIAYSYIKFMYMNKLYLNYVDFNGNENQFMEGKVITEDGTFSQNMMNCCGRHEPVQTSGKLDSFYNEITISPGTIQHTIIIYQKQSMHNPDEDYYIPLQQISVNYEDIKLPRKYLFQIPLNIFDYAYTSIIEEVDLRYRREMIPLIRSTSDTDKISSSGISAVKLFRICNVITQREEIQRLPIFQMNKETFHQQFSIDLDNFQYQFPPASFLVQLTTINENLNYSLYYIPGALNDNYRVSSGPRPNSLVFYVKKMNLLTAFYYSPILIVENVILK